MKHRVFGAPRLLSCLWRMLPTPTLYAGYLRELYRCLFRCGGADEDSDIVSVGAPR